MKVTMAQSKLLQNAQTQHGDENVDIENIFVYEEQIQPKQVETLSEIEDENTIDKSEDAPIEVEVQCVWFYNINDNSHPPLPDDEKVSYAT